ncbi:MAG: J domain-containing protein [Fimbriimonadia bacterium]|nr:J domain-containing protein [Fimbriimonadia bacterium]
MTGAYEVLGIEPGSNLQEIKGAYRRLALRWHPDRFEDPLMRERAIEQMKRINAAYAVVRADALQAQAVSSPNLSFKESVFRSAPVYSHAAVYSIPTAQASSRGWGIRVASALGACLWGILVFWVLLGVLLNLHDFFFAPSLPVLE